MRITNASGVRNDLLQEIANQTATPGSGNNALSDSRSYVAVLVPHFETERFTYTVPVNKAAHISGVYARVEKTTAGGAAGSIYGVYYLTPSGGAKVELWRCTIFINVVQSKEQLSIGSSLKLFAGDRISFSTRDVSVGGDAMHIAGLKITEFDD